MLYRLLSTAHPSPCYGFFGWEPPGIPCTARLRPAKWSCEGPQLAILAGTAYRTNVKTTIDLADDLAAALKEKTAQEGISMRAAVHEALRLWLSGRPPASKPESIPREVGIMKGKGLTPEAASRSWDDLRALSYEGK